MELRSQQPVAAGRACSCARVVVRLPPRSGTMGRAPYMCSYRFKKY